MPQSLPPVAGLHVERAGAGMPALVFVHGFACDSTDWAAQADAFASRTSVISCDLLSHGRSVGTEREATIAANGAAVARLLDELDLTSVVLVGHSMGCRVVLECCTSAADRVAGVVLLDGSRIGFGDPDAAGGAMAAQLEGDGYATFLRDFFGAMFVPSSDPALRRVILERAMRLPPRVGRPLLVDLVRWDAGSVKEVLASIAVPVLAIQTTHTNAARERVSIGPDGESAWLDLLRSHLPQVQVATIPAVGHFPHIEQAGEVTALIGGFWEKVARESPAE